MQRAQLPITALPAWAKLNDVSFIDISIQDLQSTKGYGLATNRALPVSSDLKSPSNDDDVPINLLIIPHDLILSTEAIEEHGKVDHHFRELLDVAGGNVCVISHFFLSLFLSFSF